MAAARALVALLAVDVASACWTLDLGHNLNPGSAHATCPGVPNGEVCAPDGSSNYHFWDGAYHNGIFRGVFQTNQCSNDKWGYCPLCDPPQYLVYANHSANCVNQTVPAPQYDPKDGPHGAQLRGRVGLTLSGVNIYGPEEAGFGFGPNPMPCTDGTGYCYAGVDVPTCESALDIMCSATGSKVVHELMLDSCGGHAFPCECARAIVAPPPKPPPADHYHNDNACDYDHSLKQHSVLIGIALDGHGIYGLYESYNETSEEQVTPDDLDACNGHTHGVPANATYGVDEAAVYARRPASAKQSLLFLTPAPRSTTTRRPGRPTRSAASAPSSPSTSARASTRATRSRPRASTSASAARASTRSTRPSRPRATATTRTARASRRAETATAATRT